MDANRQQFETLYDELHKTIKAYLKEYLSTLVPVKGNRYDYETTKLMVVGRAINVWDSNYADDRGEYIKHRTDEMNESNRFDKWIERELKHPFWNYAKSIFERLQNKKLETDWYQSILWSNLYPVSYSNGGNPSELLKYSQFNTARELFQAQIKTYKPTHVLIMTDWNGWFSLEKKYDLIENKQFLPDVTQVTDQKMIKGRGRFENSLVVVTCRPEFHNKEEFVNDVVKSFDENIASFW